MSSKLLFVVTLLGVLGACASSNENSEGVANPQAPNVTQCLDLVAQCARNDDCCSRWCVNGECTRQEP